MRLFYKGLFILTAVMLGYFSGWMIAGVSGMLLALLIDPAFAPGHSHGLGHILPVAEKVVGVAAALWFSASLFKE